jgi:hypothetical protein
MNKLVSGAIGVEVKLRVGINKIHLPDVINLRGKRIKHIDFCTYDNLQSTPSGNAIIALGVENGLFLTMVEANTQTELIRDIPVTQLNSNGNRLFIDKIIDFQMSYITVTNSNTSDSCYMIFWYDEPSVWGIVNMNDRTAIQPLEIKLIGTKTFFKENRDLLQKKYQNIILSNQLLTPNGANTVSSSFWGNKFLTLQFKGLQFFSQVPLYLFYQANQNFMLRLQNIQFDMQNSYIETLTTTADDLNTVFFNAIIDDNPVNSKR